MNKQELVNAMAENAGITKRAAEEALNTFITETKKAVSKGESVMLVGFGTFARVQRKARKGTNPQTGEKIKIAAKKAPVFRPGSAFKTQVAKKK